MNKVILMGRLTRDPEYRQTPQGVSVASFSIAVNRRFAGRDGQRQADFINCVAWRQQADFVSRYFHKGNMIAVTGSIQTRNWDGQDGQKHYATEVIVDEVYFTGEKTGGDPAGGNYGGYQQPSYQQPSYQQPAYQPPSGNQGGVPANAVSGFDDLDDMGFASLDGSEDDLPF